MRNRNAFPFLPSPPPSRTFWRSPQFKKRARLRSEKCFNQTCGKPYGNACYAGYGGSAIERLNQAAMVRIFSVTIETSGAQRQEYAIKEMVTSLFALRVPEWLELIAECKHVHMW